jgi:hypothetical protein
MFSCMCNHFFCSHNVARSIILLASLRCTHVAKAPLAPPILRHGATCATTNFFQWDSIVRVEAIPLELDAIYAECARCESLYSERCGCNCWDNNTIGGFRVCLITEEYLCTEARSFFDWISKQSILDTANRPATPSASLESSATAMVVSTTSKTILKGSDGLEGAMRCN